MRRSIKNPEDRLNAELEFHVERLIRDYIAAGMDPNEAKRRAALEFGGIEGTKESCRDVRGLRWLRDLPRDLRFALRTLLRSRSFAAVAILSLALGIGANAAIFQLIDTVRLRALPVKNPLELAEVRIADWNWARGSFSSRQPYMTNALWEQIRAHQEAFSGMFAWSDATFNLSSGGEARYAHGLWVSGDFFRVLHVSPMLGRLLTPADDNRGCESPGAVVSYSFWRREFGGDASVIGKKISLNGHPFEIVGVTPAGFFGAEAGRSFDVAVPICADDPARLDARDNWWLVVMGRLKPGWSLPRAAAHLRAISPGLAEATLPQTFRAEEARQYLAYRVSAFPVGAGTFSLRAAYEASLWMLFAIAAVVLLIACANLASLFLARACARQREIAVRLALGASRGRLVRQLLAESLLLATAGAAIGAFLARFLSRFLVSLLSTEGDALFFDLATDWRVLGFTAGLAMVTCALFSLAPTLRATQAAPGDALKASHRGVTTDRERFGLRRVLVVTQIALSLALLAGALLFARSLRNLWTQDAGFQQDGILIARLDVGRLNIPAERTRAFKQALIDRARAIPGVDSAANAIFTPISGNGANNRVFLVGDPKEHYTQFNVITPGYFKTLNTPLLAGRDFDARDTTTSPKVAIVNRRFSHDVLDGANPTGKRFRVGVDPGQPDPIYEIVGMVEDTKYNSLRDPFVPIIFLPESQDPDPDSNLQLVIRSAMPEPRVISALKRTIAEASPAIIIDFHDLKTQIRESLRKERLMATLTGFFGFLASVLATIGLYSVIAYTVARRRSEIGIRMALGATRRDVLGLILREAGTLVAAGIGIGTLIAQAAATTAGAMLYGLQPRDPASFLVAIVLLAAVALAASYVPASRAAGLDPVVTLHDE